MNPGDLVIGRKHDPSFVVFIVTRAPRNGWIKCQVHSDQHGNPMSPLYTSMTFRVSEMVPWVPTTQPQEAAA